MELSGIESEGKFIAVPLQMLVADLMVDSVNPPAQQAPIVLYAVSMLAPDLVLPFRMIYNDVVELFADPTVNGECVGY